MSTMGYVTTLTGAEDAASLSLDFEKQNYRVMEGGKLVSKQFSEFFSFARSTSGGRYNEKGLYESVPAGQPRFDYDPITKVLKGLLVEEQRTNISVYSEMLDKWGKASTTTQTAMVRSPSGYFNATKVIAIETLAWHQVQSPLLAVVAGTTYTASVFAKKSEDDIVRLSFENPTLFPTNFAGVFNLTTGTVTSGIGATIQNIGDGWYRCSVSANCKVSGSSALAIAIGADRITGDGVSGLYLWGAQVEAGAFATSYITTLATFTSRASTATYFDKNGVLRAAGVNVPRTGAYLYDQSGVLQPVGLLLESAATNLFDNSEDFELNSGGSTWGKNYVTVSPSDIVAPTGEGFYRNVVISYLAGTPALVSKPLTSIVPASVLTLSFYVKAGTASKCSLRFYDSIGEGGRATFDLVAGTVQVQGHVNLGGTITRLKDDAYRISLTCDYTTRDRAGLYAYLIPEFAAQVVGKSILAWGAQLEIGRDVTSYIRSKGTFTGRASTATYLDSQGLLQTAVSGVARSDTYKYDSSGILRANGLLLEGSGTNLLSNSEDFTSPSWTQGGTGTVPVVVTPAATMGPRGPDTMTSLKRGDLGIRYLSRAFSLPAGNLTFSQYVKATETGKFYCVRIQSGGSGNRVDARFDLVTGAMSTSSIGEVTSPKSFMENMGGGLWRITVSATTTVTWSSLLIVPADRLMTVDSTPVELSEVFVDCAQVESSPFASSYIPTGAASATRAADVFTSSTATRAADVSTSVAATRVNDSAPILDMAPWYNQIASSFKVEFTPGPIGVGNTNLAFYTRSSLAIANSLTIVRRGPDVTEAVGIISRPDGSVQMTASDKGSVNTGVRIKACISYKLNSAAFATQGKAPILDNTVELPTPDWLFVGNNGSNSQNLNGHIHSLQYYPVRLSDAQTQLITA